MAPFSLHDDADTPVVAFADEYRFRVASADLVLAALPAIFLAGWITATLSGMGLLTALSGAALPALATLGYALFCTTGQK